MLQWKIFCNECGFKRTKVRFIPNGKRQRILIFRRRRIVYVLHQICVLARVCVMKKECILRVERFSLCVSDSDTLLRVTTTVSLTKSFDLNPLFMFLIWYYCFLYECNTELDRISAILRERTISKSQNEFTNTKMSMVVIFFRIFYVIECWIGHSPTLHMAIQRIH